MITEALSIKTHPDPVLRKRARTIDRVSNAETELAERMGQIMYAAKGIGLAAPQIGISKKIIVVDTGKGLMKFFNPLAAGGNALSGMEEGCLSVPEKVVSVKRASDIVLSYLDEDNNKKKETFSGLSARVILHEIDHLDGKLIIDYLPWHKRLLGLSGNR